MEDKNEPRTDDERKAASSRLLQSQEGEFVVGTTLAVAVQHLQSIAPEFRPESDIADMELLGWSLFYDGYSYIDGTSQPRMWESQEIALKLANSFRGKFLVGQAIRIARRQIAERDDVGGDIDNDLELLGSTLFELGYEAADLIAQHSVRRQLPVPFALTHRFGYRNGVVAS